MNDADLQARRAARRRFDRAAPTYEQAAVIQREAGARMLERLDLVRLQPRRVLDAGCGTGVLTRALRERYPAAQLVGIDLSPGMLRLARRAGGPWHRLAQRVRGTSALHACADIGRLPLADASVELACSGFALEWVADARRVLAELHRVLARGGLLMFATLGPDTLKELRSALAGQGAAPLPTTLSDMHDIGDALVQAGFADPVMDMEYFTLTFHEVRDLLRDLRESGTGAPGTLAPGLRGRAWLDGLAQRYETFRRDGRLPATFEVVYGHAWKPEQPRRTQDGHAIVRLDRLRRRGE